MNGTGAARQACALAVATTSHGKLAELAGLFAAVRTQLPVPVRLLTMLETAPDLVIVEDGATFAANATKKARTLAARTRMLCLADDSGLEVDVLDGAPGLHSARYAGIDGAAASDEANREKLLSTLRAQGAFASGRPVTARFRCVLALVDPLSEEPLVTVDGVCEGRITERPRGERGFGYDPVFCVDAPEANGRTMAELSFAEKLASSHRARAFAALLPALALRLQTRERALAGLLAKEPVSSSGERAGR